MSYLNSAFGCGSTPTPATDLHWLTIRSEKQAPPGDDAATIMITLEDGISSIANLLNQRYVSTLLGTVNYDNGFDSRDYFRFCIEFNAHAGAWFRCDVPSLEINFKNGHQGQE